MKYLLLILLAAPCLASGPRYRHSEAKLDDEVRSIYHEIDSVLKGDVRISSVTISSLTVTSCTGCGSSSTSSFTVTAQLNAPYARYRRPTLKWISVTTVDIATNTSTDNQTCVIFPDGEYRCVTEDTSSTSVNRRFIITDTASNSGTKNSGMAPAEVESTNRWYYLYAWKTTDDSSFVVVGSTHSPVDNTSTLDTKFGSNAYYYLGLIRNGDNEGATGDILAFVQTGNYTVFTNTVVPSTFGGNQVGIVVSDAGSASSAAYTYSSGTGATDIPNTVGNVEWDGGINATAGDIAALRPDSAGTNQAVSIACNTTTRTYGRVTGAASKGVFIAGSSSKNLVLALVGFTDIVLGGETL